jgi:hypothetical protein
LSSVADSDGNHRCLLLVVARGLSKRHNEGDSPYNALMTRRVYQVRVVISIKVHSGPFIAIAHDYE